MGRSPGYSPPANSVRDLGALTGPDVLYGVGYLALAWAVIAGALIAVRLHPTWWVIGIAFVLISARQQALLNVEHSCIHGTFLKGKRWNELVGMTLAASPVGSPYNASRARHLEHHRWLGTDRDPDSDLHRGSDKESATGLLKYFFTGLLGGYAIFVLIAVPKVPVDQAQRRQDRRNILLGQLIMAVLLTATGGWWFYPVFWVLPLVTLTAAIHLVRSFCEHAIIPSEAAEHADRLITIRSNPVERFLIAPYNMNYHSEHHRYPGVPAHKLAELQHRLASEDADDWPLMRRSYLAAVVHYLRGTTYVPARA